MPSSPRLALLLGLTAAGCVPVPLSRPAHHDPTLALDPTERLGVLVDGDFEALDPNTRLSGRVHVLVHGWAPGWYDEGPPRDRAWEARRDGARFDPWMRELARAIVQRDPPAHVLVYSWLDDAATTRNVFSQRRAYPQTALHGRLLAAGLARVLEPSARVHLVGHSFGGRLAAVAAGGMPRAPEHLTVLDAPESILTDFMRTSAELPGLLRALPVGRGTFVDVYASSLGTTYLREPDLPIVRVQTTPPMGLFETSRRHRWATRFYVATAGSAVGLGWSPLLGGRPPAPGCYRRPYDAIAVHAGGCSAGGQL